MIERAKCMLCCKIEMCDDHHYIPRGRHLAKGQRVFKLGRRCHSDVHNLNNRLFYNKYGVPRWLLIKVKEDINVIMSKDD